MGSIYFLEFLINDICSTLILRHSSNYNNPNVHSVPLPVHPINPLGNHAVNMAAAAGAYAAAYPFHLPYYHQYGVRSFVFYLYRFEGQGFILKLKLGDQKWSVKGK